MRIYYVGREPATDPRLAGVQLRYGLAVDVPVHLGRNLITEAVYSVMMVDPVDAEIGQDHTDLIDWYTPPPGEELLHLDGVGPRRAAMLVKHGVTTLEDLVNLSEGHVLELASQLDGVTEARLRGWIKEARTALEVF